MTAPEVVTRIERVTLADGERVPACEAADKAHCSRGLDHGVFRFERVRQDTGEVWRRHLCLGAAAALAQRLGVEFPPLAPADLADYLEERSAVARQRQVAP